MAILNVAMAFPLALIFFRDVCGQTQPLPLLCIGSALLVIGIAVDGIVD